MNILFLCNANMGRSPLAEGLLKHILKIRNIKAEVDSAGFEVFHINDSPDIRAIRIGQENGIDISSKKVRLFTVNDFDRFDKIYVMDTLTYRSAMDFARNMEDKNKIDFLMNLINPEKNKSVPDPFFRKLEACRETYDILRNACEKIADHILEEILN